MLKGTLDDFTLADIFRLASLARRTGKLEVVRSAGHGKVFIRDGEVYYAESSVGREPLGQKLIRAGVLSESALMKALDENASTGRRVGEILVESGAISIEQLETALQAQIEDAVFDLLRWDLGDFTWEPGVAADVEVNIAVSVENLIIEASRRLDELEVISRKIPTMDTVLRMAPRPPEGAHEINITPEEWRMLVLVDGSRSVRDIATTVAVDDFTALRALYGLVSAGLAEVKEGAEAAAGPGEAIANFIGAGQRFEFPAEGSVEGQQGESEGDDGAEEMEAASGDEGLPSPEPTATEDGADDVPETEDGFEAVAEAEAEEPEAEQPEAEQPEADQHEADLSEAETDLPEADQREAEEPEADLPEAEADLPEAEEEMPAAEEGESLDAATAGDVEEEAPATSPEADVATGFDLEMDPGSLEGAFDPMLPREDEPVFQVEPVDELPEAEDGSEAEAEQEPVFRDETEVDVFDEPAPDELVSQGPADPFLSELLGDQSVGSPEDAVEEGAADDLTPEDFAPDGPSVDRSAVVRELAGLFDDERPPRPQRERQASPEGSGSGPERKRVEDDDQINKGLIGRLIDGVKGL